MQASKKRYKQSPKGKAAEKRYRDRKYLFYAAQFDTGLVCAICQRKWKTTRSLARHVAAHGFTSKSYFDAYLKQETEGICKQHGQVTKYQNLALGYAKNCSQSCGASERAARGWSTERLTEHKKTWHPLMGGGRKKGSKNNNPYPSEGREAHVKYWSSLTDSARLSQYKKEK
jgi:hypothetical protein